MAYRKFFSGSPQTRIPNDLKKPPPANYERDLRPASDGQHVMTTSSNRLANLGLQIFISQTKNDVLIVVVAGWDQPSEQVHCQAERDLNGLNQK